MALRDQPYLPLYIQDFLTDEKLIECSAESTGVYIRIMCIMHKSAEYGKILLKQKDKQTYQQGVQQKDKQIKNFAAKLVKHLPYTLEIVEQSISELVHEGVLLIEDDYLVQKRMVRDNDISLKRSKSGSKGGSATAKRVAKLEAKEPAKTENENENENESELIKKKDKKLTFSQTEEFFKGKTNQELGLSKYTNDQIDRYRNFISYFEPYKDYIVNHEFISINFFIKEYARYPDEVLKKAVIKMCGLGLKGKVLKARMIDAIGWSTEKNENGKPKGPEDFKNIPSETDYKTWK